MPLPALRQQVLPTITPTDIRSGKYDHTQQTLPVDRWLLDLTIYGSPEQQMAARQRLDWLQKQPKYIGPAHETMAAQHLADATHFVDSELTGAVPWFSEAVTLRNGPMLPGNLIAVGAQSGSGKTTFLVSVTNGLLERGVPVVYFPLEIPGPDFLLKMACARAALRWDMVMEGRWDDLRLSARDDIKRELAWLARQPLYIPALPQATTTDIIGSVDYARTALGAQVAIVDHVHRVDFGRGAGGDFRHVLNDGIRTLKTAMVERSMVLMVASQLTRHGDPLDIFLRAGADRFSETKVLVEESDLSLTLSRSLRLDVTRGELEAVKARRSGPATVAEPNIMLAHTVKHRRRDMAQIVPARLKLDGGLLVDAPPPSYPMPDALPFPESAP